MTLCQIDIAFAEAPNYSDVDSYVSEMLLSTAVFPLGDDTVEPDMSMLSDLRKVWYAVHEPFRVMLSEFGLTQVKLHVLLGIPLRTVQAWALDERHCPPYVTRMIATILLLHVDRQCRQAVKQ